MKYILYFVNTKYTMELSYLGKLRFTDDRIKYIIQYIKDGSFPENLSMNAKNAIRKTYKDNNDFGVRDNKLYYTPKNIEIIPSNRYEEALKERFKNQAGIKGIHQFYYWVNQKYFIPRVHTTAFLKKQSDYQLTRPVVRKQNNKSVVSYYPNAIWEADLMFLTKPEYIKDNPSGEGLEGFSYLLNVIDVFSRKMWSVLLNSRDTDVVSKAFRQIVDKIKISPTRLLTDGGGEFNSGEFREMLSKVNEDYDNFDKTVLVIGSPYSPTSQSIIERGNGNIRQKIKQAWVKQGNFNYTRVLTKILNEYNQTKHSHHNFTPNELWKPTRDVMLKKDLMKTVSPEITPNSSKEDKILYTAIKYAGKSETINLDKKNDQVGEKIIPVGTVVRLSQKAYSNKVRSVYKSGFDKKKIAVYYLPTLYKIKSIFKKPSSRQKGLYLLEYLNGRPFQPYKTNDVRVKSRKAFYRNELMIVDKNSVPPESVKTQKKANEMNVIEDDDDENDERPRPTPSALPPRPPPQPAPLPQQQAPKPKQKKRKPKSKKAKQKQSAGMSELEILRQRNLERRRKKSLETADET